MESVKPILEFKKTCVSYTKQTMAVKYVSAAIERNTITAIMGPSGCGKSTLLRAVNLMHNLYPNIRVDGEILLNGENILAMEPIDAHRWEWCRTLEDHTHTATHIDRFHCKDILAIEQDFTIDTDIRI